MEMQNFTGPVRGGVREKQRERESERDERAREGLTRR